MHISNLPTEILVDILARLDSDSIESVQLLDRRFNAIVRRNNLYKPVAECIKFSSRMVAYGYTITVSATLTPKNNRTREKSLNYCLSGNDYFNQAEDGFVELVKQFGLTGTKSIDVRFYDSLFNVFDVLQKADVSLEELEICQTRKPLLTPFVTKEFMDRLITRNPKQICFRNCQTQLHFSEVVNYLQNNFKEISRNPSNFKTWQFGVTDTSEVDLDYIHSQLHESELGERTLFHNNEFLFFGSDAQFNCQFGFI